VKVRVKGKGHLRHKTEVNNYKKIRCLILTFIYRTSKITALSEKKSSFYCKCKYKIRIILFVLTRSNDINVLEILQNCLA
jgi:hypothetical protein